MGIHEVNLIGWVYFKKKHIVHFDFKNTFKKLDFMGTVFSFTLSVSISELINRKEPLFHFDLGHILYYGFINFLGYHFFLNFMKIIISRIRKFMAKDPVDIKMLCDIAFNDHFLKDQLSNKIRFSLSIIFYSHEIQQILQINKLCKFVIFEHVSNQGKLHVPRINY